jgi:ribonuclease BN (tRNA processing enzyme)
VRGPRVLLEFNGDGDSFRRLYPGQPAEAETPLFPLSCLMSTLILIPMGVGEAFTARHYTTCLALGLDDTWLLIDCPHPIRKMLREGSIAAGLSPPLDLDRIHAAVVTHLHADHCCGLEDFGYYTWLALDRRAKLLMHPAASARLWDGLLSAGMGSSQLKLDEPPIRKQLADFFELTDLDDSRPVACGPFAIECRRTIHSVPTFAVRITAGGRVLGFSADTAHDPGLIEWLSAADLIVHEATTLAESPVHTPYARLVELPASLRAKMRLSHLPDDFDADSSAIEVLREGRVYEV